MIHNVQRSVNYMMQILNPNFKGKDYSWDKLMDFLSDYKPKLFYHLVSWEFLSVGHLKCNTDGLAKEIQALVHMGSVLGIIKEICVMLWRGL